MINRSSILALIATATLAVTAAAQWQPAASFPEPGARFDAAGLNHNGILYAIGGQPFVPGGDQTPIHYLDPNDPNATTFSAGRPAENAIVRQGVGVDMLGRIVVFGGVNGIDPEEDGGQTYQYDIVEGQWTGLADRSAAAPADYFAFATDDLGRIYSIGGGPGESADAGNPNAGYVERYLGPTDAWEVVAPLPVPVADAAAVNDGRGHLLVFGGFDTTASTRLATIQRYDVTTNTWTLLADMPAALTGHCAATGVDGRVYVIGGVSGPIGSGTVESSVHVLHLDTMTWSAGPALGTPRTRFAAALRDDDHIYALGGLNDSGGTNTAEKLFTPTCPGITTQPLPMQAYGGSAAGFSITVSGTAPFAYQWYRDGLPLSDGLTPDGSTISGANAAALTIYDVRSADAGTYDVDISNVCGTTRSQSAALTVVTPGQVPTHWQVESIHPAWAQNSSIAHGVSNGMIGGSGTTPTLLPDGRTFTLAHPVVWDTENLVPVDVTPAGSVGGQIFDVEGDLLVGWFWHTWTCPGGTQSWTCAWQSAGFWTAPSMNFLEAVHSSGAEYDAAYGTDGFGMVGTLTYEYTEGNYDSRAHYWPGTGGTYSLHNAAYSDSFAYAVDGDRQFGSARAGSSNHAMMWTGSASTQTDLHPGGFTTSTISGAGNGQAVGHAGNGSAGSHAGLWIPDAAAFIDLHPDGTTASSAVAAHGGIQAGNVDGGAALWVGSAETWIDLHLSVPPAFTSSYAEDFEMLPDGRMIVVGYGYNSATTRTEALVWRSLVAVPGDLDSDGDVDLSDLAIVLGDFGCTQPPAATCPGDADGDGDTDLSDLAEVLANFGT